MEYDHRDKPIPSRHSSASSAVEVPAINSSGPSSPALNPSDSRRSARKRTSWTRQSVEEGHDPLSIIDLTPTEYAMRGVASPARPTFPAPFAEDPFYSPPDDMGPTPFYSTSQPGPSSASLMSRDVDTSDDLREDDEAHLTANMSRQGSSAGHEGAHTSTPHSRKRTIRYSATPSPGRKAGGRLKTVSRSLRRASLRVVNLAGMGLEDHGSSIASSREKGKERMGEEYNEIQQEEEEEELPDLARTLPVRGRTLGFLGPDSKLRLAMYRMLVSKWTEPVILLLIIANAIILTIQSSRSLTLPDDGVPLRVKGYFHTWEDYALFVLFILFTLEAFARICVSGFLLDPEIPVTSMFSTTLSSAQPMSSANATLSRQNSLRQGRKPGIGPRLLSWLQTLSSALRRPFALAHHSSREISSASASSPPNHNRTETTTTLFKSPIVEKAISGTQEAYAHMRQGSTYAANVMQSDKSEMLSLPFRLSVKRAHDVTRRNLPYLRHSWNRIDFVAVVSFWVTFALATFGIEHGSHHIGAFRAMSVLRCARLLAITSGTTTIMRSLKIALPLLTSVAYFVVFAILLFSIIGVQTFQGSFRRTCYLLPTQGEAELQIDSQTCGGYIDNTTLETRPFIRSDNTTGEIKGYICPLGQICLEGPNADGNAQSFDTIYYAILQVVIIASANGWSPLMYGIIDSEYFASCFFFIIAILVLNFWLINLFVAVITNTFSAIRADTNKSAFGAAPLGPIRDDDDDIYVPPNATRLPRNHYMKEWYEKLRYIWVAFALASIVLQATRTTDVAQTHKRVLDLGELVITGLFDVEIIIRFLIELPDWRNFFRHGNNWLDLVLAIGCSIIQIPVIRRSGAYPWLTAFQVMRFYRVILEVPRMKPLMLSVFGNMYGLVNMTLFLLLVNYLAALVTIQLLRGDLSASATMNFGQVFNAFLGVYQVFSSENWTDVLFGAISAELPLGQAVLVAIFVAGWFLFANFIVLQMFIAVINENFDVAEEAKKSRQAAQYSAKQQPQQARSAWVRWLNPYRWLKPSPKAIAVENLPSNLILPMQKALVQDYSSSGLTRRGSAGRVIVSGRGAGAYGTRLFLWLEQLFTGRSQSNDIPLAALREPRHDSLFSQNVDNEELDRHFETLAMVRSEAASSGETEDAFYERRARKADFIRDHPTYDRTFWIFSQKNPLRRMCQRLVYPANGERIFGLPPSPVAHTILQVILLLAVIGGIAVEGVATPVYRRNFYLEHGQIRGAWFDIAESAFGLMLVLEFLIKIVADGVMFTPNSYFRSLWNFLDFLIMAGLLVNLTTALIFIGGLSRLTRSLKALRALRLITLIDKMRKTFEDLIISGAVRILDAALLAMLYMIPYAVWGLNIFAGKMNECNDDGVAGASQCVGEYDTNVIGDSFGYLVPRVWDNPSPSTTFSFDSFRASLLILFEIVSLEGWIDVLGVATSITGEGKQPQTNASEFNAIFFLIYNLMGGVVILTLFVSIIIANFSSKTGAAFRTQAQREWIDLKKLIRRQRPSKRPRQRPTSGFRAWCFDRAVRKHGSWSRFMTALFVAHVFALMTQTFNSSDTLTLVRDFFFLAVAAFYVADVLIRFYGLGWRSFKANGWNLFDALVAGGSLTTTAIGQVQGNLGFVMQQLEKLFLVSIAFKLVQRTNSLNKLFKTAVASLPVILSLLALWLTLFLFFAILFVEVFSLTKWGSAETREQNYSTLGSALVMLAFMSTGEGWNQYMHDYALVYPRCTNSSNVDPDSDCGSIGWAFTLFIAWNLLSMYIFVNMFTGVVVQSFGYVMQTTGGAKSITREEMRAFKKVWGEYANPRTGLLDRTNFVPFFGRLSGIFEVRIYPAEYSIPNIMALSAPDGNEHKVLLSVVDSEKNTVGVDTGKLGQVLSGLDHNKIRQRRNLYIRLYHEASVLCPPGKGISFTDMLLLLAHYKLINDHEALELSELVVRNEINKIVTDLVNLDRVRSLLKMISHRRRYLAHKQRQRQSHLSQDIPAIVVDSLPPTPPPLTRDITSPGVDRRSWSAQYQSPEQSPTMKPMDMSPDVSLGFDSASNLRRSRRVSDISMLSAELRQDYTFSSRESVGVDEDPQQVVAAMQNSLWGEMMLQAAEDED